MQIINNEYVRWLVAFSLFFLAAVLTRRGYFADGSVRVPSLAGFTALSAICALGLSAVAGVACSTYQSDRRIFYMVIQLPYLVLFLSALGGGVIYALAEALPAARKHALTASQHMTFKRWNRAAYAVISIGLILWITLT